MKNTENNKTTMELVAEIKTGKCQFNATSAKKFRDTLAKWYNAQMDITQELLKRADRVKALNTVIASNKDLLQDLADGKKVIGGKTQESIQAEIDRDLSEIQALNETVAEFKSKQEEGLSAGESLLSKELYNAYCGYMADVYNAENIADYEWAIAEFLKSNGVEPRKDTVQGIRTTIGKRSTSAREKYKTGKMNAANKEGSWRKLFLGELVEMLLDVIPVYKFKYIPVSERVDNKKNK